jgi:hypothetical protein
MLLQMLAIRPLAVRNAAGDGTIPRLKPSPYLQAEVGRTAEKIGHKKSGAPHSTVRHARILFYLLGARY